MTCRSFVAEPLMAEYDGLARRRSKLRARAANLPPGEGPADLRLFDASPNIAPATIHTLASSEWIKEGQPLCLIGGSRTGKSPR
ncbi:hypothetical protein ACIQMV_36440 [Streptomyces sp. NPDC091412]|uniref:hypothetical protein n=1 Tax=Streptomyces sp. NPDC091412 TaxID=3366002 RepID=UPI0038268CB7